MAHYALLDSNNVVVQVIVGKEEGEDGVDWEQRYGEMMGMTCKRTSYNTRAGVHILGGTPFRKNYAGIGYTYDYQRDAFIPRRRFYSWTLNPDTCLWEPPVPMPNDGKFYNWNEATTSWIEVTP